MKIVRIVLGAVAAFIALTAIGGGIAILTGVDQFPLEWLAGTPFNDYTIPALLLAVVVGGTALLAAVEVFLRRPFAVPAAILAGLAMVGYIVGELVLLKQPAPRPTTIEWLYLALGGIVFVMGAGLSGERTRA